jgi:hypothetical protein
MPSTNDAERWRSRAAEARVLAETLKHPDAKRALLDIASGYLELAEDAEERVTAEPSIP